MIRGSGGLCSCGRMREVCTGCGVKGKRHESPPGYARLPRGDTPSVFSSSWSSCATNSTTFNVHGNFLGLLSLLSPKLTRDTNGAYCTTEWQYHWTTAGTRVHNSFFFRAVVSSRFGIARDQGVIPCSPHYQPWACIVHEIQHCHSSPMFVGFCELALSPSPREQYT